MDRITDTFKAIYAKYPYLLVLFVSMLLTLPWIIQGEFYTKGEPREATVATCILNTGNWVLPSDYADEVAYKPPFMHWFIAAFSLPAGHVTETTARLPSALGLIGIVMMFFALLYKRVSAFRAVLTSIILLTSFEMHRSGIEARVDMTLAFFMIGALISMFKWEEKGLKGYPWLIPVFLAGAALVKGPVGIVLPCLVFGLYLLLLRRYSLWNIILKNVIVALPALAVLLVWYVLAYQQGGEHFLNLVYAENFGRFLGEDKAKLGISYELGHKGPFWYYLPAILLGFMPWSLLAVFSLFSISFKKRIQRVTLRSSLLQRLAGLDKLTLFSIVSVVIILDFYAIPSSKRSVYIMPAYPFAAYLLTLLYKWAVTAKPLLIRIMSYIVLTISGLLLLLVGIFHFVNLLQVATPLVHDAKTLRDVGTLSRAFQENSVPGTVVWVLLLVAFLYCIHMLKKGKAKLILTATLALFVCTQVFLEQEAYPAFKTSYSSRHFAEKIQSKYNIQHNMYVMNDLNKYMNLYGLNFYLNNDFKNFDKEQPKEGYFITGLDYIDGIRMKYAGKYKFEELERSVDKYNDFGDVVVLYKIIKNEQPPIVVPPQEKWVNDAMHRIPR